MMALPAATDALGRRGWVVPRRRSPALRVPDGRQCRNPGGLRAKGGGCRHFRTKRLDLWFLPSGSRRFLPEWESDVLAARVLPPVNAGGPLGSGRCPDGTSCSASPDADNNCKKRYSGHCSPNSSAVDNAGATANGWAVDSSIIALQQTTRRVSASRDLGSRRIPLPAQTANAPST